LNNWLSLKAAAAKISVSVDISNRRADMDPVPGGISFKRLKLGEGTRPERRYFERDVEALLK
jgi:hypothetical protein